MQQIIVRTSLALAFIIGVSVFAVGQSDSTEQKRQPRLRYTDKGFEFSSADSNYLMHIEWRGQFRLAYPTDNDPITLEDFDQDRLHLSVNRARMKVGGHAYKPYYKYYLEYELFAGNLLDFRLMLEKYSFLKLKVGQWKAQYNRERIISSGKQQTLERSLLTRPFTIDRQQGLSLYGRLGEGSLADFNYWASVFMGTGRGASGNDDEHMMYMTRWQWNFMGESLTFSGSDLGYHDKLGAVLAGAFVTNRSPYTRFSQAGGGQLPGFEEGVDGQYRVYQWLVETAGMLRGFAWQTELHWKEIQDLKNGGETQLIGNLVQIGYFFHHLWPKFPKELEIYWRHAVYDPNRDVESDFQNEYSFGANWFIRGHRNKLTAELSLFSFDNENEQVRDDPRFRLQWDVSF